MSLFQFLRVETCKARVTFSTTLLAAASEGRNNKTGQSCNKDGLKCAGKRLIWCGSVHAMSVEGETSVAIRTFRNCAVKCAEFHKGLFFLQTPPM